jgi:hypothetical protein
MSPGKSMKSQFEIFKILLTKDITQIITEVYKLQIYIKRAITVIESLSEEDKERVYQVAGDLIEAVPVTLKKVDILLSKILYAINIVWRKELKVALPFDERSEVESLITPQSDDFYKNVNVEKLKKVAKRVAKVASYLGV